MLSNGNTKLRLACCTAVLFAVILSSCRQHTSRFIGAKPSDPIPLAGNITASSAVIEWVTADPATSQVEYGLDRNYSSVAGTNDGFTTTHEVTLLSLLPSTLYHYRTKSRSTAGNALYSYDKTFQTASAGVNAVPDSIFDFESDAYGWLAQTSIDSQAVRSIAVSPVRPCTGGGSLAMVVDLRGGSATLSKGEAYVQFSASKIQMEFLDLTGKTVSAWVYAPAGAQGDSIKKNGFQMFVKDSSSRSQYGPWTTIDNEDSWFQISMIVGGTNNAYTESGFDPSSVVLGGIKIGAGTGSTAVYNGNVYADNVKF